MPGDISGEKFWEPRHYSGVRNQQGRVQLDSDENEQLAIGQHRTEVETVDVIGPCGVPEDNDGFRIGLTSDGSDLTIKPGRIYVDGLLGELDYRPAPVRFPTGTTNRVQLDSLIVDDRRLRPGDWVEISAPGLAALQTMVLAIDPSQPVLTVLGNLTAFQSSTSAQLTRLTTYTTQPDYPNPEFVSALTSPPVSPAGAGRRLSLGNGTYIVYLDEWQREVTALDDPHIREVALGGPDTTTRIQNVWQVRLLQVAATSPTPLEGLCEGTFVEWNNLVKRPTGTLNARAQQPIDTKNPCLLPPSAGFQRLENQTYRVQIQNGGANLKATFKFSRENASVETTITNVAGSVLTVSDLGKDEVLGFAGGQWVEIVDTESELKSTPTPRPLFQIDSVLQETREITLKGPAPSLAKLTGLKLRRWDQTDSATKDGLAMTGNWQDLESGVQVRFSDGTYRSGDFWIIPARTATADVEWPPFLPSATPLPQPPLGIAHHFCRLAIATVVSGAIKLQDCRKLFPPLTKLHGPDPGIHVQQVLAVNSNGVRTRLLNDSSLLVSDIAGGIEVVCDQPIDPLTIIRPTCFVVVETDLQGFAYTPVAVAADVGVNNQVVTWKPKASAATFLSNQSIPAGDRGILTRLTLKGNFIWSAKDPKLYLDGDVFGFRDSNGLRILERLPSGNGIRGGDFETWFWIGKPAPPPPFTFTVVVPAPAIIRTEGLTELVSDIVVVGTGGPPTAAGAAVPVFNVQVIFNTNITNTLTPGGNFCDAVLMMCDPVDFSQPSVLNTTQFSVAGTSPIGVGGTGLNYQNGSVPNIFQGRLINQTTLLFTGVPIDPPGFGQRTLRIKNVRLNDTALGGGLVPVPALCVVSLSGPMTVPVNNPQAAVAFGTRGLNFSLVAPPGAAMPLHFPINTTLNLGLLTGAATSAPATFMLQYQEGFASAFKIRKGISADPFVPHSEQETGYDNVGTGSLTVANGAALPPEIGAANPGTRFQTLVKGMPPFVNLFVTTRDLAAGATEPDSPPAKAILVAVNGAPIAGSTSPGGVPLGSGQTSGGVPIVNIPLINGNATLVWEYVSKDPVSALTVETLQFGVVLAMRTADNVPTAPTFSGTLAPVVSTFLTVPRFVDVPSDRPAFTVP